MAKSSSSRSIAPTHESTLINPTQQSAIYSLISKLFGLSIRNNGSGKFQSTLNGDTLSRSCSISDSTRSSQEDQDSTISTNDIEETLRLILDKLLQIIDVQFLEQTLEYLSSGDNQIDNYQHLYACSGSLSSLSLSGSEESLTSTCSSLSSSSNTAVSGASGGVSLRSAFNKAISPCLQFHPQLSSLVPMHAALKLDQKQSLIKQVLGNCQENLLIPSRLSEPCSALEAFVTSVLSNQDKQQEFTQAVDAVFLFATLLHSDCRQRLLDLVTFLQYMVENEPELLSRDVTLNQFAQCFVNDHSCISTLRLLITQSAQIFVPWSNYNMLMLSGLHKRLERSTFSNRISVQQYQQQKHENTTDELMALLAFVLGDQSTLTARQKDKLISAMQSKHPEVYGLYSRRLYAQK